MQLCNFFIDSEMFHTMYIAKDWGDVVKQKIILFTVEKFILVLSGLHCFVLFVVASEAS